MKRWALLLIASLSAATAHGVYNGEIDISGQVFDESANPLTDIKLEIQSSQFTLFNASFSKRKVSNKDLASGKFSWRCRRCTSVQLYFSRKGYHSETLSYSVKKDPEPTEEGDRSPPFTEDLKVTNVRVVLRSAQNVVRLKRSRGRLYSTGAGAQRILPLDELASEPPFDSQARFLSLLPVVDDTGALTDLPGQPTLGAVMRHPAKPMLVLHGGGGLVAFRPGLNKAETYLQMREAPSEGYVSSLKLDAPLGEYTFFYVKSENKFGKGYVTGGSYSQDLDEESVTALVEVRFNESGSRNVETMK